MHSRRPDLVLFSGNGNRPLTEAISKVENETKLSNINAEYISGSFQIDDSTYYNLYYFEEYENE